MITPIYRVLTRENDLRARTPMLLTGTVGFREVGFMLERRVRLGYQRRRNR